MKLSLAFFSLFLILPSLLVLFLNPLFLLQPTIVVTQLQSLHFQAREILQQHTQPFHLLAASPHQMTQYLDSLDCRLHNTQLCLCNLQVCS